jgi:serine/threonine-protein kinase
VHRATHVPLGHEVAIKLFHPHVWDDPAFRVRFRRECEALTALEHPNVIPVLDAGESDGTGWIVMHLARGGTLADRLAQGPLHSDEALAILRQVASALDAAHAEGRLHRDVKPENVLLEPDGHAWLADFGVARAVGNTTTVPGQMIGTAAYMAPEVIGGGRARPAADLYAFTCMAFECLTGRRPFPDGEVGTVLFAHLERTPPRARSICPDLPRRAEKALQAGLAKDPRDRPRSATALVDALDAAMPRPDATMPYGALASAGAQHSHAMHASRDAHQPQAAPKARRGLGFASLAAASVLLVGGAVGAFALMSASGPEATTAPARPPLPAIPTPDGEVTGSEAPRGAVPGATAADRVAATSLDDASAFAVNAGTGRSAAGIAAATVAALEGRGLDVVQVDLEGDGTAAIARAKGDFLQLGDTWAIAQVPGARAGAPDRVLVLRGTNGAPARYADALSESRPASLLAPR